MSRLRHAEAPIENRYNDDYKRVSYTGWIIVALAVVVAVYWTPALIKIENKS